MWNVELDLQGIGFGQFDEVAASVHSRPVHDGGAALPFFGPIDDGTILRGINLGLGHLLTKIVKFVVFQFQGLLSRHHGGVGVTEVRLVFHLGFLDVHLGLVHRQ